MGRHRSKVCIHGHDKTVVGVYYKKRITIKGTTSYEYPCKACIKIRNKRYLDKKRYSKLKTASS